MQLEFLQKFLEMIFTATLLVILFLFSSIWSKPIFVDIPPRGEECYFEDYTRNETIEFLYVVKRGGDHDIELKIYSPNNALLTQKIGTRYDRFTQKIDSDGVYRICFNNHMSRFTSKLVGIDLLGTHRPQNVHYHQLMKKRNLNMMERSILNIGSRLDAIDRLQSLAVEMEETYEDAANHNSSLSSYTTMIELTIVLVVYLYQIKTIRSWFKHRGAGAGFTKYRI